MHGPVLSDCLRFRFAVLRSQGHAQGDPAHFDDVPYGELNRS